MILGIDEVGRGPWAGPLVVGAVVLDPEKPIEGLTDSKKLSAAKRAALNLEINEKALAVGLGWVDSVEIDSIGLSEALRLATRRAVEEIKVPYHEIIIDGTINFLSDTGKGRFVTTMKKADLLIPGVSAASIVAKVARDDFMALQDNVYGDYGFASHVGYGTARHRKSIQELGLTPLHRNSFAPIAAIASGATAGSTKGIGDKGENRAAEYLKSMGFEVIGRNWRTKWCEIDIIAQKDNLTVFFEVKTRGNAAFGSALEAVTSSKLSKMTFAAELYCSKNKLNSPVQLGAVLIDGDSLQILMID